MSFPLILRPGVNTMMTALLNESAISACNLIRWRDRILEIMGGWTKFSPLKVTGICRGLIAFEDFEGNPYLAAGTDKRLELYSADNLYDITPLRTTHNVTPHFSTTNGSAVVNVKDVGFGAIEGSGINIVTPVSVGGLILKGYYEIVSIIDADNYHITAASNATATVANGGAVAAFTTTNGSPSVSVLLANHGFSVGDIYTVYVSTTGGGLTLFGDYGIDTVPNSSHFTFTANASASATTTFSENAGNVRINYLIEPGNADQESTQGYGIGGWGEGTYGFGEAGPSEAPRQWSMGEWNNDIVASPTDGAIYTFVSATGPLNNPATIIANAPIFNTQIVTAMPQQQIIALGTEDAGQQDRLLIKWCSTGDYTKWRPVGSPTDPVLYGSSGFYRITKGARIVGGLQSPTQTLIWTDQGLWVMQYIGSPFWYSFNQVGFGCGLISSRAAGMVGDQCWWLSQKGLFRYAGGQVQQIPCSVWDNIFKNLNSSQVEKITSCPIADTNEMMWQFPSADGTGEVDMYIKVNVNTLDWDYGAMVGGRSAWIDKSVWGGPIGARTDGYIMQHEVGYNDDDQPMDSFAETGWFEIAEGDYFLFVQRFFPDFKMSAGSNIKITMSFRDYNNDDDTENPVRIRGPFTINSLKRYVIVRGRGRFAKIRFESQELNCFWRLGKPIYFGAQTGKR